MARKRYIETHSNYTLKQTHQMSDVGKIYERDYSTIYEMDGYAPGRMPVYSDGTLKLSDRRSSNRTLKHNYGGLVTEPCDENSVWTLGCIASNKTLTSSSKIRLNPASHDLNDFACYGSATELIRATMTDILLRFPSELFLTNEKYSYYEGETLVNLGDADGKKLFIVENPFDIDVYTDSYQESNGISKLRYLRESYESYDFIADELFDMAPVSWGVTQAENRCFQNGDWMMTISIYPGVCNLYYYYYNGEKILLHDYKHGTAHIRPNENVLEEFYSSLDDFETILLNRRTNHTAKFNTPEETDTGIYTSLVEYQWPIMHGWNLDFNSANYEAYTQKLMDLAEMYDTYYADNITKSLTHEAIKNFDWTNRTMSDDAENEEQTDPNPFRMEAVLHVYGRMFDELLRHIRNIKHSNNVTYDGDSNLPDYFLSDALHLSGWDVKNPLSIKDSIVTGSLYPSTSGSTYGYTANDANNLFMKLLKLNSRAIMSAKGTKRGIEMLLALFGFHSIDFYKQCIYPTTDISGNTIALRWDDLSIEEQRKYYATSYSIDEYVAVARDSDSETIGYSTCPYADVSKINSYKDNFNFRYRKNETYMEHQLQGLPLRGVSLQIDDNEPQYYVIPWFDKSLEYDDNRKFYFQSRGGWGKHNVQYSDISTFGPIKITSDETFSIYDENQKYLHFAADIEELLMLPYESFANGDIYYLDSIRGIESYKNVLSNPDETPSHYFCLIDEDFSDVLGTDNSGNYGWKGISEEEIGSQTSPLGKEVAYLESIIDEKNGSSIHIGHGDYDGGNAYLDRFAHIFSGSKFDKTSDRLISGYENLGFTIDKKKDNTKCWYFTDTTNPNHSLYNLTWDETDKTYTAELTQPVDAGGAFEDAMRETEMTPFNMEDKTSGYAFDEAAANSIINVKDLEIKFYPNTKIGYSLFGFTNDIVMYYLKQIIPSTTLLSYDIPDIGMNGGYSAISTQKCGEDTNIKGVVNDKTQSVETDDVVFITVSTSRPKFDNDENGKIIINTNDSWSATVIGDKTDIIVVEEPEDWADTDTIDRISTLKATIEKNWNDTKDTITIEANNKWTTEIISNE